MWYDGERWHSGRTPRVMGEVFGKLYRVYSVSENGYQEAETPERAVHSVEKQCREEAGDALLTDTERV